MQYKHIYKKRLAGTEALDFYPAMASRLYTTYSMLSKRQNRDGKIDGAGKAQASSLDAAWRRGRLPLGVTAEEKRPAVHGRKWGPRCPSDKGRMAAMIRSTVVFFSPSSPLSLALVDRKHIPERGLRIRAQPTSERSRPSEAHLLGKLRKRRVATKV